MQFKLVLKNMWFDLDWMIRFKNMI